MKYRKSYKIEGKVFREEDILRLAEMIRDLYAEQDYEIEYTLKSNDDSSVSGGDMSIFDTDYFKRKKIGEVEIKYYGYKLKRSVVVALYSSLVFSNDSTVHIESDDEVWLHDVSAKLDDFFNDSIPQNAIWKLPQSLWRTVITITGSCVVICALHLGMSKICDVCQLTLSQTFIYAISVALIFFCIFLFNHIYSCIEKAYPRIEFQFGNHEMNKSSEIRKIWAWVFGSLLIPVMLMIIGFFMGV